MNTIEERPNQVNLALSYKDGRITSTDKPISSRIVMRSIVGTKSLVEVDVQMIISSKEADAIYEALSKGKVYVEVSEI